VLILLLTVATFEFFHLTNSVPGVSAVEATGTVGIYWNAGCTKTVSSIDWGNLSLGQTETVVVYADNEGNQSIMLTVTTANYSPANASEYLNFSCANMRILANETVQVTQSLYVSPNAGGISDFSFDIIFTAKQYVLGDINGDGVVNIYDAILMSAAYGSHGPNYDYPGEPASSNWNPNADLNNDGVVDIYDVIILSAQLRMSVQ
jgi:hypothetical protein